MKESSSKEKEDKNSFSYAFKQQILKAWQPVPTIKSTICLFTLLGLFFLSIGIALFVMSGQISEVDVRYDTTCIGTPSVCQVNFNVPSDISGPVFMYYQLEGYYQNHRRYIKSRDNDQLGGIIKSTTDLSSTCDPIVYNSDLADIKNTSYGGVPLDRTAAANPCGLVAKSFFNDTYNVTYPNGSRVIIDETGIAWPSDIENKFAKPPNASSIQWVDVTNEHFIVWMRTAATPNFRKLWGRIDTGLPAGNYVLTVNNNYNVIQYSATKTIVFSTANSLGGKNNFLAIAYIVVGSFCLFMVIIFTIKHFVSPNKYDKFKKR
jgi:hypothetical protein